MYSLQYFFAFYRVPACINSIFMDCSTALHALLLNLFLIVTLMELLRAK